MLGGMGRNRHRAVGRHDAIGDVVVPFDIIEDQSQETRWVDDGGLVCGQILDLNLPSEEDELGLVLERAGDLVRKGVDDGGRHSWRRLTLLWSSDNTRFIVYIRGC